MKYAAHLAALAATAAAQQFVQYTPGGDDTAVERIDPIITPGKQILQLMKISYFMSI